MDIQKFAEAAVRGLFPESIIERARLEAEVKRHEQRVTACAAVDAERERLKAAIQTKTAIVEKCRSDVAKKFAELKTAELKMARVEFERRGFIRELDAAEREFVNTMRGLAPKGLLEALAARVDLLLEKAVPDYATHVAYDSSLGIRQEVLVVGNADARRKALFLLKRDVQQKWFLEPLTPDQLEQKFETAVEALPAIVAPPSRDEFLKRHNAAVA